MKKKLDIHVSSEPEKVPSATGAGEALIAGNIQTFSTDLRTDIKETAENPKIAELRNLAERYRTEQFIVSGIDEEARENNRLVMEAVTEAKKTLDNKFNDVFGVHVGGSRIKGYNTKDSDIDLVVVSPRGTSDAFAIEAITKELKARGVENRLDEAMGMWSSFQVETDPEEFIYKVDHHGGELITLFGHSLYDNPNLQICRLAALEVVKEYEDYDWSAAADEFAKTYLGERDHLIPKLAERYGLQEEQVLKIFTHQIFRERYKKFGLEDPQKMYRRLKSWYKRNVNDLKQYRMTDLYRGVLQHLKAGN